MKTVVVFQGGGALGAFCAGAWSELARSAPWKDEVVALAGASIGALNAALAARHRGEGDGGADELPSLWRSRLATPAWPFLGAWPLLSNADAQRWNGFLTGLLLGNRGMSVAAWPVWQPASAMARLQQPLHSRLPLWRWLGQELGRHDSRGGAAPLLAVAAVDVDSGELCLFDSHAGPIGAQHVAASMAMPLMYDPVEIDGRLLWDGEVSRESLMPSLLRRLLATGIVDRDEPLRLVTLEVFPRPTAARPLSGTEITYRVLALQQHGKLEPPAIDGIRIAQWLRIERQPLAEDGVSGQMDFSPERVERLLEQGRQAARRVVGFEDGESASDLLAAAA